MCTDAFAGERLRFYEDMVDKLIAGQKNMDGACLAGVIAETSIVAEALTAATTGMVFYRSKLNPDEDPDKIDRQIRDEIKDKLINIMEDGPTKRALTRDRN